MSRQQVRLHGSKKKRKSVNEKRAEACVKGEIEIAEALDIDGATISDLRAQAHALYLGGKWSRCVEVLRALAALGHVEPYDPVMLSRCFDEVGDEASAAVYAGIAERVLSELEAIVTALDREKGEAS